MAQSSHRLLRVAGIVAAVILLWLAFYPGTLSTPYVTSQESPRYAHPIVPESSPLYEEYTEEYDHEVYRYDERSPVGQELFDRTRVAESRPQYNGERRFIPDVCRDFMLVCDTYSQDEFPDTFTYGEKLTYEEAFVFIEDGDERYLLRTGSTGHGPLFFVPVRLFATWLTMLPLAALIAAVTVTAGSDRVLGGAIALGTVVAILGFLTPYLEMNGLGSARAISVLLLAGVWLGILAAGGYTLYQLVADDERRSTPDGS